MSPVWEVMQGDFSKGKMCYLNQISASCHRRKEDKPIVPKIFFFNLIGALSFSVFSVWARDVWELL